MNRYILTHLPMALIYGVFLSALKGNWLPLTIGEMARWGWFVAGTSIGVIMLFLDRVVYTYSYPTDLLSQQFAQLIKEKRWKYGLELLDARREEQNKLTFRSALFMAVWVPLSFFAITSTTALFGKGVVMGLMLHILLDAWRMQKSNPERLNERLFWQIARPIRREEQLVFMYVMTALFLIFSWWVR